MTDAPAALDQAALDPVALTRALVRCRSVTPADAGALDVLQGVLEPLGFVCHRLRFEEEGTAPVENLYARLGTKGPNLCFAGHTDVVPPGDPAAWAVDPFAGEIVDGKLYGRGASDMKAAVAAFTAAVARRLGSAGTPPGSISLLITGDEEGPAVNGTRKVLDWLADRGEVLDACIVGEPTNPNYLGEMIKVGRRGSITGYLTVHGTQGHVAYPHLADNPLPRLVRMLAALTAEPLDRGNAHFQPSTLAITTIDVGNPADNVIPAKGSASFNIRFNDEHTSDGLKDWIRRTCDAVGGRYDLDFRVSGESFLTPPGRLSDLVADAVERVTGHRPELSTTGGTSDARFIKSHCPVVEFGIVGQTMHKVDEHVAVADVERLTCIYGAVIDGFFAPATSPSTGGDAA
ncbi:succinyl-diaminopimelate desuccinylase [Skermanella pratensis]|uniref:succinyl-diaminopimelate desuccinylase n=1 Tax=Skermanella pratensis TaxID=2233999 RepID=UPI001300E800|nr:succinyl-diaminopimelate desuccinylase [Skermanella pratensis]